MRPSEIIEKLMQSDYAVTCAVKLLCGSVLYQNEVEGDKEDLWASSLEAEAGLSVYGTFRNHFKHGGTEKK